MENLFDFGHEFAEIAGFDTVAIGEPGAEILLNVIAIGGGNEDRDGGVKLP